MQKVEICGLDTNTLVKLNSRQSDELLKKIKQGDKNAREDLIVGNIRLVLSIVHRFHDKGKADDFFQAGMMGLIKAVDNFDDSFNVRFSTYAVPMIIGEIRRFIKDTSIKVSRSMRDTAYKALKEKERIEISEQRIADIAEIAKNIQVDYREVVCALDAVSEPISLQESVYSDEDDSMLLMEQIGDRKASEEIWVDNLTLRDGINKLPEREKTVLTLRYYIGKTQIEISTIMDISQAQVSRLEKSAIAKLKSEFVFN